MDRREPARSHLRLPYSVKVGCVIVLSPRGDLTLSRKRDHICAFACSVKVGCVVVYSKGTNFIAPHEGSDRRIEV